MYQSIGSRTTYELASRETATVCKLTEISITTIIVVLAVNGIIKHIKGFVANEKA